MPKRDVNIEALKQVEKATNSEPVLGEDLLESTDLKARYREIKKQFAEPLAPEPPSEKPVK